MNTKNLKSYAPKARRQFMDAIEKRAAHFGIYPDKIVPLVIEGGTALIEGRAFSKHQGLQRKHLEKQINNKPLATHKERYELFVREMAYTWFNRLAALRFMELHDYLEHGFRVLSHPTNKDGSPEILDHAVDVADMLGLDKAQIIEWQLAGDKQEVMYRELLLGQCHHLHSVMPFLFEAIDDATELLLPDNLTKTDSILKGLVNDIPEEDWQQIEVIGWLYQFYISEHKDAVMGKVVKSEDIPAATQLFTPNWIVKYLVQNSIGRQWLATYPDSSIKTKMEYYIEPAEQTGEVNTQLAAITPSSIDPESIKALDPACGSGHILVEIYELLREIYLERGYRLREIPELILTKNIYGLDIDDRAAQLAGFALLMKAREDDRRIFQRVQDGSVKLNVYALQSTEGWDSASLWKALNLDGKAKQGSSGELFAENASFQQPTVHYAEYFDLMKYLIVSFEQAKTLGSLIQIDHKYLPTLKKFKDELLEKLRSTDPAAIAGAEQLLPVVEQAIVLAQKYDAIIANPPYMGGKWMNPDLKKYIEVNRPDAKTDLYAAFIELYHTNLAENGSISIVAMESWMFLPTFEKFRKVFLKNLSLTSLVHMPYEGKGSTPMGINFGTAAFVAIKATMNSFLTDYQSISSNEVDEFGRPFQFPVINEKNSKRKKEELKNIPGEPIAYWASEKTVEAFKYNQNHIPIGSKAEVRKGLATGDNEKFIRYWHEIDFSKISFDGTENNWVKCNNGGEFRKWYGNQESVIYWKNDGYDIRNFKDERGKLRSRPQGLDKKFLPMISWTSASSSFLGVRFYESGFISDQNGNFLVTEKKYLFNILGFLCTSVSKYLTDLLNPSKHILVSNISDLPLPESFLRISTLSTKIERAIEISKFDWDSFENSWNFNIHPILKSDEYINGKIATGVSMAINEFNKNSSELLSIEQSLEDILTSEFGLPRKVLSLSDITLNTNPYFTFKNKIENEQDSKARLRSKLIADFLSYCIGCSMGRYSIDRKGLVYANARNEGFKELLVDGTYQSFQADDDAIIPLASEEWLFADDATARFREFVKTVWGVEHLQENLEFVAESLYLNAIKPKKGESAMETIRRYFSTQFFADHCKMYKKRPIYWLFSSGKEKAFECLVYLHRYNEATLSRMRTEYVTPLMGKYDHQLSRKMEEVVEASGTEQRRIEKEIKELEKKQLELRKFDEELKHYAEMRISLDLDDGVKVNYGKFGNLLANVKDICG